MKRAGFFHETFAVAAACLVLGLSMYFFASGTNASDQEPLHAEEFDFHAAIANRIAEDEGKVTKVIIGKVEYINEPATEPQPHIHAPELREAHRLFLAGDTEGAKSVVDAYRAKQKQETQEQP
jgi:hypothetical protein